MTRRLPPLNALRAFEAAARFESFSRAADTLGVTHGAVSRQVRHLEQSLGIALFERRHRRVLLTEPGRELFRVVADAFDGIESGLRRLGLDRSPERLVVAIDPDFASLWLVPCLADLRAAVPGVALEITASKDIAPLSIGRADCAVHYGPEPPAGLHVDVLFRSTLFPVCAPSLTRGRQRLQAPCDLRHHTLLHDRTTAEWYRYVEISGVEGIDCTQGLVFSETALSLEAAARGQGIAIGDDVLSLRLYREGRLTPLFGPAFGSPNAYYFLAPKAALARAEVRAFRKWLLAAIAAQRGEFSSFVSSTDLTVL